MTNTELIKSGYEAFARQDIPAMVAIFAPDITWYSPDSVRTGGTFKGPDEIVGFFSRLPEAFQDLQVHPQQYVEQGDTVVVLGHHTGSGLAAPFDVPFAHVWTVHAGKVTSFYEYFDTVKLNAALG